MRKILYLLTFLLTFTMLYTNCGSVIEEIPTKEDMRCTETEKLMTKTLVVIEVKCYKQEEFILVIPRAIEEQSNAFNYVINNYILNADIDIRIDMALTILYENNYYIIVKKKGNK